MQELDQHETNTKLSERRKRIKYIVFYNKEDLRTSKQNEEKI